PALRRLAKLAPRASAREHLRHLYQNQATANCKNRRTTETGAKTVRQNKQFLKPTAPLRRQRIAESALPRWCEP
ncbi:MAG: hypothetical protein K2P46_00755, partial [Alistipes sp.]|nr:hypothetical protein [Alistipes sp.]